jgi:hypothetical protein
MGTQQFIWIISSYRILSQLAGTDLPRSSATLRPSGLSLALQSPPPALPLLPVETVARGAHCDEDAAPGPPCSLTLRGKGALILQPSREHRAGIVVRLLDPKVALAIAWWATCSVEEKAPLAPTSVRQRGPEGCRYRGVTGNWMRRMGARGDDVR